MAQQPLAGQDYIIIEASKSHSDTPHSVKLLWTSDKLRRRDLYFTTHITPMRQISMPPAGFEPAAPASEEPQTHALDRTVTSNVRNVLVRSVSTCSCDITVHLA